MVVESEQNNDQHVWMIWQRAWRKGEDGPVADRTELLVEAGSCAKAAELAQENDGTHEIEKVVDLGPIVAREKDWG